jgi:endonuclease/exonuclease/phosphatase family metal-dependent hydrolase
VKSSNGQKKIQVINTHFDNKGAAARKEAAGILLNELTSTEFPLVLMGDLNSEEDSAPYLELTCNRYTKIDKSTAARIEQLNRNKAVEQAKKTGKPTQMPGGGIALPTHIQFKPHKLDPANLVPLNQRGFKDARYELQSQLEEHQGFSGPYGHKNTFTSFDQPGEDPPAVIDYILLGNTVQATKFAVLENRYEDNLYISDHRPVMATVNF